MTYYTIGMLREQRNILADLIVESYAAILDGNGDQHYNAELWRQWKELDWFIGERMALVAN